MKTTSQQRFSFNSWDRTILTLPTHTSFGRGKLASLGQDGRRGGAYPFSCLQVFSIDVGLNTIFLFQLLLISKIRFLLKSSNNFQLF
jgi:hypothetical protein